MLGLNGLHFGESLKQIRRLPVGLTAVKYEHMVSLGVEPRNGCLIPDEQTHGRMVSPTGSRRIRSDGFTRGLPNAFRARPSSSAFNDTIATYEVIASRFA